MAVKEILVYNPTSSQFEVATVNDTTRVKTNSTEAFVLRNNSGDIVTVDTTNSSVNVTVPITASGNFSASLVSTGSFGRVDFSSISATVASAVTDVPASPGTLSSSVQIGSEISGALTQNFPTGSTISGSAASTASFDKLFLQRIEFNNVEANFNNLVSSSTQIASKISGAFQGFDLELTGSLSGSATSTASFQFVNARTLTTEPPDFGSNTTMSIPVFASRSVHEVATGSYTQQGSLWINSKKFIPNSWGTITNMTRGARCAAGVGNSGHNMMIVAGDYPAVTTNSECWDGSTWTTGPSISVARAGLSGGGNANSATVFGGDAGSNACSCTEEWNGNSWSTGGALATPLFGRTGFGAAGSGNTWAIGGSPAAPYAVQCTTTECYNGTSWSTGPNLGTPRFGAAGGGRRIGNVLVWGGTSGSAGLNSLECFTHPSTTFTAGPNMTFARDYSSREMAGRVSSSPNTGEKQAWAIGYYSSPAYVSHTEGFDSDTWVNFGVTGSHQRFGTGVGKATFNMTRAGGEAPAQSTAEEFFTGKLLFEPKLNFTFESGSGSFGAGYLDTKSIKQ